MNIVLISDENYAVQTAVTLQSFFEHNEGHHDIYFLTTGVKEESRIKLFNFCEFYNSVFHYICIDDKKLDPFDGIGYWSKYTFMKILIPELLPSYIDKVLYLDVDIIVKASLSDLYSIDLAKAGLAAVEDVPNAESHKKRCCLSPKTVYINSGLMLMNMPLWRIEFKMNSFFDYIDENKNKFKINDQDVINSVFENRIIALEWKYNVTSAFFGFKSAIWKIYPSQYKTIRKKPVVIHFTNSNKPWISGSYHIYKKEWYDILKRSNFTYDIKNYSNSISRIVS